MSKRIKPNAEHRIVDGEIISGSIDEKIERGQAYSQEKQQQIETGNTPPINEDDVNVIGEGIDPQSPISDGIDLQEEAKDSSKSGGLFTQYRGYILWFLLFLVVLVVLFVTRPNMDWQVQKINDLQSELAQLKQDNSDLNQRLQNQETNMEQLIDAQVAKVVADLSAQSKVQNQSTVSQTDLSDFENQMKQQIEQLKDNLTALSSRAANQTDQALSQLNQAANEAQNSLAPTQQQLDQLKTVEQKLQSQINRFGDKLSELFAFKTEQQTLTKQPPKLTLDMPLDSLQIQQWIVEVNTQWVLNGRTEETTQQLLALEQAVSLSDFKYTTQLARLIGQDLGYLKQLQEAKLSNPLPTTEALKQAVNNLTANKILQSKAATTDANKQPELQGLDALLERFSQMITVKKRVEDSVSEVDELLINDVLTQRLALQINRLDWGLQTQSNQVVEQAIRDIEAFITRYYSAEVAEFKLLLEPFANIQFPSKRTLSIMQLDEVIENQ